MLVMKENERLYPATWEYNAARIMTELAKIVENHGGTVKPLHNAIISNRSVDSATREYTEKLTHYKSIEKEHSNPALVDAIKSLTEKLEALAAVNNEPITVTHTSYITFTLDGFMYYYQVDSNPFFEFYYHKTPVKNGRYSLDAGLTEDKKEWLYDCFFSASCSNADVVEAANLIFNMLVSAKASPIIRDGKRCRVANVYNSGYHYETVYSPERFAQVDF